MFEIRFYGKKSFVDFEEKIIYHIYDDYDNFEQAADELKALEQLYKKLSVDNFVFKISVDDEDLENYVINLDKNNKKLVTISKVI